jgi:putative flippase GtrA
MIQAQALRAFEPSRGLLVQAGRFLVTGGLATLCHWLLLLVLVEALLLEAVVATSLAYAAAAALNYWLRRCFVFRSQAPHHHVLPRYLMVLAAGFGLNAGIMALGADLLALPYLAVQIAATGAVTVWNFAGHRAWTFGEASEAPWLASHPRAETGPGETFRQRPSLHPLAAARPQRLAKAAARQHRPARGRGHAALPVSRTIAAGRSEVVKSTPSR